MSEENKITEVVQEAAKWEKSRRAFVKTAAQVAVTAPAVGLILNATTRPAAAAISPYQAVQQHLLDDFTFGSNEEDVDANLGHGASGAGGYCVNHGTNPGNFNPFNGIANQDDVCVVIK